jgi:hypothetical protein
VLHAVIGRGPRFAADRAGHVSFSRGRGGPMGEVSRNVFICVNTFRDVICVRRGSRITKGQKIARCGRARAAGRVL